MTHNKLLMLAHMAGVEIDDCLHGIISRTIQEYEIMHKNRLEDVRVENIEVLNDNIVGNKNNQLTEKKIETDDKTDDSNDKKVTILHHGDNINDEYVIMGSKTGTTISRFIVFDKSRVIDIDENVNISLKSPCGEFYLKL